MPPASSQLSLPPQWLHRWTTGDQPPDMATASQAISSCTDPSPAWAQTVSPPRRMAAMVSADITPMGMPTSARARMGEPPMA